MRGDQVSSSPSADGNAGRKETYAERTRRKQEEGNFFYLDHKLFLGGSKRRTVLTTTECAH